METKFKVGDKVIIDNISLCRTIKYIKYVNIFDGLINQFYKKIQVKFEETNDSLYQVYPNQLKYYMKIVVLPIEIAKKMYLTSKDESVREFALSNYSKEELEAKELPKSWEELKQVTGCAIDMNSDLYICNNKTTYKTNSSNRNIFPTKSLAEAVLALSQLLQLREVYRNGWVPDYDEYYLKYSVISNKNNLRVDSVTHYNRIFTFQSKEIAQQFLSNFEELLEIAKPLI